MKIKVVALTAALMAAMLVTGCSSDSAKKSEESSKTAASSAASAQESKKEADKTSDAGKASDASEKKESSAASSAGQTSEQSEQNSEQSEQTSEESEQTSEESEQTSEESEQTSEESEQNSEESKQNSEESGASLGSALERVKAEVEMPAETADTTARRLKRDYGITDDMYDDFAGLYCTDGLAQDTVVYVKAKDETSADQIAQKLQDSWQSKYNVIKNYSPEQMANIEAAKVERNGLYVSLVISADAERIKSIFNEAIG